MREIILVSENGNKYVSEILNEFEVSAEDLAHILSNITYVISTLLKESEEEQFLAEVLTHLEEEFRSFKIKKTLNIIDEGSHY